MKWFIVTTLLIATAIDIGSAAKNADKSSRPLKKANSLKPTKHPKSILDEFSGLNDDDTKFLKELDKQFKIHGDQIKIQVKKVNTTTPKNSKRTIDGSLGYGYHQPQQQLQQGFFFSQPKFMVYPYSQQDILPQRFQAQPVGGFVPNNGPIPLAPSRFTVPQSNLHTAIRHGEPQQSPQGLYGDYRGPQLFPHQPPQNQAVPVIVLRIPGPQRYANHLQALLQRYLELRAQQYISELQQQEQENFHIAGTPQPQEFSGPRYLPTRPPLPPQRLIPVHQTPVGFVTPGPIGLQQPQIYSSTAATYTDDNVGVYPSQAVYEDHQIVSPQPFQNGRFNQNQQQQHYQQVQQIQEQQQRQYVQQIRHQQALQAHQQQIQQQQEQQQQQQQEQEEAITVNQREQLRAQQQAAYEQSFPRDQPEQEEEEENEEEDGSEQPQQQFTLNRGIPPQIPLQQTQIPLQRPQLLPLQPQPGELENQPPINENYPSDSHTQVILPQQRIPPQQYHEEVRLFRPQQGQPITQAPYNYQAPDEDQQLQYNSQVEITPKPPRIPYNYHAHPVPVIPERRRDTGAPYTQEQFRKYNNAINRLKKKQPIVVRDE